MALGYAVEPVGQRRHSKYSSKYRLILPERNKTINFILQLPTINTRDKTYDRDKTFERNESSPEIISPVSQCSETIRFLPSPQFLSWSFYIVFITNYNILIMHVQQAYQTNYLRTNRNNIILP